ncbi:MAG: ABC transporter ATP-binding protein [Thermoleophilia bacterium]
MDETRPSEAGGAGAGRTPPHGPHARQEDRQRQPRRGGPGHGPSGLIGSGEKAKDFRGSFKRLMRRLHPERGKIGIVVLLATVAVVCSIAGPKILARAIDLIFAGYIGGKLPVGVSKEQVIAGLRAQGDTQMASMLSGVDVVPGQGVDMAAVGHVVLFVAAVYVLSSLFMWLSGYIMAGVVQRTVYRLRADVSTKLARLPLKYFDDHARGDTLSRITNDIDNIQQTLQQTFSQIVTALLTLVGVVAMMFWISWLLALISLFTIPVSVVVTMLIAKRSQKQFALQWESTGSLNGHVEEMYSGHNIVKVFGRQKEAIAVFDEENDALYRSSFKAQFISGIIMPSMMFIGNLNYVAICVVGGLRVAAGAISLGDVQAFIQYSRQFTQPITQVASVANVLQSAVASAERVFEMLDEVEEAPDVARSVVLKEVRGHVSFQKVSFRYLPDTPLIEGLDLEVMPGQMVAIVGPTGAGKTTLVNLLMRFYEIDSGRIMVDGVNIRDMRRQDLRQLFGMVLQHAWLFGGTIQENIAYGKDDATPEDILRAAKAAHVDRFVRTLPEGYETRLDDDSTNISQGERQLITIARAFLADPEILILDEATSSVDTRTEMLIQKAMSRLLRGRTSFVIAHRLSTIRDADVILVMNEGSIIEQGTHQELLDRRGFYYDLYNSQFAEALVKAS